MLFGTKAFMLLLLQSLYMIPSDGRIWNQFIAKHLQHLIQQHLPKSALLPSCQAYEICTSLRNCRDLYNVYKSSKDARNEILKDRKCSRKRHFFCCPRPRNFLPTENCGRSYNRTQGREAGLNEFPWMAMLLYGKTGQMEHHCGGSLINNWYVLTASHCVRDPGNNGIGAPKRVRLGAHNTNPKKTVPFALPYVEIDVVRVIPHEKYFHGNVFRNDIALLQLKVPVRFSAAIKPICLPTLQAVPSGRIFEAAGWGNQSSVLRRSFLKENNPNGYQCKRLACDSKSQICAGGDQDGNDTCEGDSGGPLMDTTSRRKENVIFLAGIISYGYSQRGQKNKPSIYTKTEHYLEWISSKLAKN
ncbi:melanization protease 1 [Drosophila biarmipes]|uniref:melanization protease 1 n=1 Tax=Drosophila biarmipes TaxID=125945 RepID=UPI0007E7F20F|nr:melanization protease 1 [Drosophila biarmipes]XP_050743426.1 melanization protease 1 [Drosophila biarmipes]XP_050743427.1 melanization protease 1 [Drosophila biarmipes]